jgi:hypothetical protein
MLLKHKSNSGGMVHSMPSTQPNLVRYFKMNQGVGSGNNTGSTHLSATSGANANDQFRPHG